MTLFYIFTFIFGTIVGSFLNVVILRLNTGMTMGGRSQCFSCGKTLRWYELIPVVSFFIQKGRCRNCKSKISWQYPAVEIFTGLMFLALALEGFYLPIFLFFIIFFCIFLVIVVYDIRHKIIPTIPVLFLLIFSIVSLFLRVETQFLNVNVVLPSFLDIFAGPILALPFALVWFFSKGRLMGLGDAKIILVMGWLLGLVDGLVALVLSFWIATVVSLAVVGVQRLLQLSHHGKQRIMKIAIPFAPFLFVATLISVFFGQEILRWMAQVFGF